MITDLKFHHIGKVVVSIQQSYVFYRKLGFRVVSGFERKLIDKKQNVRVGAVTKGPILIELLEPIGNKSPVANFLTYGHGFHHICYHSKDLERVREVFKNELGFRQITPVTSSVWNGRPVVFFINSTMEIIELIGTKNAKP